MLNAKRICSTRGEITRSNDRLHVRPDLTTLATAIPLFPNCEGNPLRGTAEQL